MPYTSQLATTTTIVGNIGSDLLSSTTMAIGVVLGIAVLLTAVGFAWSRLQRRALHSRGF